jgi:hypothetical protein
LEGQDEEVINYVAQVLREEPMRKPQPSFDARVMASIRWGVTPRGTRALFDWFFRPRRVALSPIAGIALAAAFAGIAYLGAASATRRAVDRAIARQSATLAAAARDADMAGKQLVQFVLVAPNATSVSLVGDFNDWKVGATPLSSGSGNMWSVQIPLTPGRYNYIFMIDGKKLVPDPTAPRAPVDAFGQPNSVITVGSSD